MQALGTLNGELTQIFNELAAKEMLRKNPVLDVISKRDFLVFVP